MTIEFRRKRGKRFQKGVLYLHIGKISTGELKTLCDSVFSKKSQAPEHCMPYQKGEASDY